MSLFSHTRYTCTWVLFLGLLMWLPAVLAQGDDDDKTPASAGTVRMDDPAAQQRVNREIWESIKRTPYSDALSHVAAARALAANPGNLVTLPTGWRIGPAGTQISAGHLPFDAVIFNGAVVVMNTGYYDGPQNFMAIDPATGQTLATVSEQNLYPGAAAGLDGKLYVSGGLGNAVYSFDAQFNLSATYSLPGYARGLASLDASHIVASHTAKPADGGLSRPGHLVLIDTTTGQSVRDVEIAREEPYSLAAASGKIYASIPALSEVIVTDNTLKKVATLNVGLNPLAMCQDAANLFVVNENSDSVSVINTQSDQVTATFQVQFQGQSWGAEPISCAVDDMHLYVTLAQANAVAVLRKADGAFEGYIPAGWYPSKVLSLANQVAVVSAKGIAPLRPNADGTYVLNLLEGTLGLINKSDITANLAAWTQQVEASAPYITLTASPGSQIDHVFFIVKENRTYDQVLGDLGKGNGDPYLTTFGSDVTPIQHYLASNFVTLDNTYVDGEVSSIGHSVTSSGYASPYFQMLTSLDYSDRLDSNSDDYPGGFARAFLWDVLNTQNVNFRIYGEAEYFKSLYKIVVQNLGPDDPLGAKLLYLADPDDRLSATGTRLRALFSSHMQEAQSASALQNLLANPQFGKQFPEILVGDDTFYSAIQSNANFAGQVAQFFSHWQFNYATFNLNISDLDRIAAWMQDFKVRDLLGQVPPFSYLILPNDHTAGRTTPRMGRTTWMPLEPRPTP